MTLFRGTQKATQFFSIQCKRSRTEAVKLQNDKIHHKSSPYTVECTEERKFNIRLSNDIIFHLWMNYTFKSICKCYVVTECTFRVIMQKSVLKIRITPVMSNPYVSTLNQNSRGQSNYLFAGPWPLRQCSHEIMQNSHRCNTGGFPISILKYPCKKSYTWLQGTVMRQSDRETKTLFTPTYGSTYMIF